MDVLLGKLAIVSFLFVISLSAINVIPFTIELLEVFIFFKIKVDLEDVGKDVEYGSEILSSK